jgi:hypothetical protein
VYANDTFGFTGASETVTFTVATFPTTLVMAAAVVVALVTVVAVIGVLVYLRKRNR